MNTANEIWIKAKPGKVFELAEAVEQWPSILPHYRYVKLLDHTGDIRTVKMAASRTGLPVSWTSLLYPLPRENRIRFRHIRGITTGMEVEWRLVRQRGGTHVTIEHDLRLRWPPGVRSVGELVIGRFFVSYIAAKTLCRIKRLAEER